MVVQKCSRCKRVYEMYDENYDSLVTDKEYREFPPRPYRRKRIHLCKDCKEEFEKWMEEGRDWKKAWNRRVNDETDLIDVDALLTAYDPDRVVSQIVKNGETGITADKNFARGIAIFTEKHLKNDLIRIAEENWTDSQVKMLKGLICAAVNGIEYADAYEAVNRD